MLTNAISEPASLSAATANFRVPILSHILAPLSQALDLVEGQPLGHSVRSAIIGMRLAEEVKLPEAERGDLFYALLMKDAGSSFIASGLYHSLHADEMPARSDLRLFGWPRGLRERIHFAMATSARESHYLDRLSRLVRLGLLHPLASSQLTRMRAEHGAAVVRRLHLGEPVAEAVLHVEERWDGHGWPDGLRGWQIPAAARIISLAQVLEVLRNKPNAQHAVRFAAERSETWFDPDLVRAAHSLYRRGDLFAGLESANFLDLALEMEPDSNRCPASLAAVDAVCKEYSSIVDAKSPFTTNRSGQVVLFAQALGTYFGFSPSELRHLRRGAQLHDLGMLAVPNSILEKPSALNPSEEVYVQKHPWLTLEILNRVPALREIAPFAAARHEALDGSGYLYGVEAKKISLPSRILAVADSFHALLSKRPHRDGFDIDEALQILEGRVPDKLDPHCVEALAELVRSGGLGEAHLAAFSDALGES